MENNDNSVKLKDLGTAVQPIIKAQKDIQDAIGNVNDRVQASVVNIETLEKKFDAEITKMNNLIEARLKPTPPAPEETFGLDGALKMQMRNVYYKSADGKYEDLVKGADLLFAYNLLASANSAYRRKGGAGMGLGEPPAPSERLKKFVESYKAYTETGVGTGDEIVPLFMRPELWQDVFIASRIAGQFEKFNMPTNPFDLPLDFAEATFSKIAELGSPTADDAATRNVRGTVTKQLNLKEWSYEIAETAIVPLAPALRANVLRGAQKYIDSFWMNADSAAGASVNINLIDATPAASSYYLSDGQNGIRYAVLVDNTGQGINAAGALTSTQLASALTKMDDYGIDTENLRFFPGLRTYLSSLRLLPENLTMDKFGPNASIKTGQVAVCFGSPVIPTPAVELVNAAGKKSNTGSNNTKGALYIVHRGMWLSGYIRNVMIEMDIDIKLQKWIMVTSYRLALYAFGPRASIKHAAGVYNITLP